MDAGFFANGDESRPLCEPRGMATLSAMPSSVRNLVALLAFVVVCIPSTARAVCGDGMVDPDEECEPTDLLGLGCVDFGFAGGLIGCTSECRFDLRACTNCGNALVDADEQCDGANLGGLTCADLGFHRRRPGPASDVSSTLTAASAIRVRSAATAFGWATRSATATT